MDVVGVVLIGSGVQGRHDGRNMSSFMTYVCELINICTVALTFILKVALDSIIVRPDDDRMTVETCRHS